MPRACVASIVSPLSSRSPCQSEKSLNTASPGSGYRYVPSPNTGPGLGEGTYLYPLPGEAVFSDFSLWQGDRELKGETMDATQARGIYETIVRQKRDPALIELAGHGLLRARVFPINPGETRKITLRYTQLLDRVGDAWRFRYVGGPSGSAASRSFRLEVDTAAR